MGSSRSLSIVMALGLALLATLVGGCGAKGEITLEPAAESPAAAPSESPAVAPSPLLAEPVLFAFSRTLAYERYQREPLLAFRSALVDELGEPLQLRVMLYVGTDDATGEQVVKGEILQIYYQESEASLSALRSRADELVTRLLEAFPEPGPGDSLEIYARLPEGKTVAHLVPELAEACGDRNMVRAGVGLAEYAGNAEDLYFALCDGARVVGPNFADPESPLVEEAWRLNEGG